MMCEFKKGDKIICIKEDNNPELIKGKIYEVKKPNGDFVYLKGCEYGYFTFLFRKECEYCKEIELLRKMYKVKAQIISETKHGKCLHEICDINYCPVCGRNLKGGISNERNIR